MAVSTNSYFNNCIVGVPQVGADIDIYESSTSPKYAVGFGFQRSDGSKYRYCHFGLLSPTGKAVGTDSLESSTSSTAMSLQVVAPTIYTPAGETIAPNKKGSRYLQINNTGANLSVAQLTQDVWAGGYIGFLTGSGTGYSYRIKGNSVSGNPATGETYIELYDVLHATVDTTTAFTVQGSLYGNLEPALATSPRLSIPTGFNVVGHTAGSYGWICTKGITVAITGTPVGSAGSLVILSTNTAGTVVPNGLGLVGSTPNYATVGILTRAYSASAYCLINATLE